MIKVLYEDNHLLCIEKPINMPAQPDSSHDASVLDVCKSYLRETYAKKGTCFAPLSIVSTGRSAASWFWRGQARRRRGFPKQSARTAWSKRIWPSWTESRMKKKGR